MIGGLAGFGLLCIVLVYLPTLALVIKIKLDDAVAAFAIHGGGGM